MVSSRQSVITEKQHSDSITVVVVTWKPSSLSSFRKSVVAVLSNTDAISKTSILTLLLLLAPITMLL